MGCPHLHWQSFRALAMDPHFPNPVFGARQRDGARRCRRDSSARCDSSCPGYWRKPPSGKSGFLDRSRQPFCGQAPGVRKNDREGAAASQVALDLEPRLVAI